jgi:leucyl-tRNA synthetase
VRFRLAADDRRPTTDDLAIEVFTTRPDTIYGATYMVLAPEHPLVDVLTTPDRREEVEAYRQRVSATDLVTRKTTDKEKTGVFTGGHAVNPATGDEIPVWIADYVLMEYGTGAIMAVPGHDERDFEFAKKFGLPIRRVIVGPGQDASTPLDEAYVGPGVLVNSAGYDGLPWDEAKRRVTADLQAKGVAEPQINYRLHDWCISRQRYWGPPIPVLYCDTCGTIPVPEDQLPVVLPFVEDYKPDESGISPLARHEEWYLTECPACGGTARRETDVSDTFLDSAWYFLRYPSAGNQTLPFDPEITREWLPVDTYIGGNEHAVLHLLYSRYIAMVLNELGHVGFAEPFRRFRAHGHIVKDGAKMSKTKGNIVVPDQYIAKWGADTFRTYLMFLGPFQEGGDFRDEGISGPRRFLDKVWALMLEATRNARVGEDIPRHVEVKWHETLKKAHEGLESLRYNTAIAAMMELVNALRDSGCTDRRIVEDLVVVLAPFAPHFAEECWERLGHGASVFEEEWPEWDEALTVEESVELAVQVNGKTRSKIVVRRGSGEELVTAAALADPTTQRFLGGKPIRKTIHVPDRLVNLVVG